MDEKILLKEMPPELLPRERLLLAGVKALSDKELLAIVLRTGSATDNVLMLSERCLTQFTGLWGLKQAAIEELKEIKGIGEAKAIEIKAVCELGCRMQAAALPKLGKISSSFGVAQQMIHELKDFQQEHLVALYLNTKNEVIHKETIFIGSLNQSIAHPREIFQRAVKVAAAKLIAVHNHPSGNPDPSRNDLELTKRLQGCGELLGIELLDHLIIGQDTYISLREEGYLS